MEKYLLFIKSIINQGAYLKGSPLVDFYLKRCANRYYYVVYLVSLIFFAFIVVGSLGFASENRIMFHFLNEKIESINFIQFAIILILQTIFWKTLVAKINKQDNSILNIIKLYCNTAKEKIEIYYKAVFFNGFSFRILLVGVVSLVFVINSYFPSNLLFNAVIAFSVLISSIFFIVSIECLMFYLQTYFKFNSSVFSIVLYVVGLVIYNYLNSFQNLNLIHLIILIFVCLFFYAIIRKFIKNRL